MRRGKAAPRRPGTARGATLLRLAIVCAAASGVAASPTPSPAPRPERSPLLQKLLTRLMVRPTHKLDQHAERIDYIVETGDFMVPSRPGGVIDEKNPSTFIVQRATVTLIDAPPFALKPDDLGPEDSLWVQIFLSQTGHLQWENRDQGIKGPAPGGAEGPIPFFGRDQRVVYRDYLERIMATLEAADRAGR